MQFVFYTDVLSFAYTIGCCLLRSREKAGYISEKHFREERKVCFYFYLCNMSNLNDNHHQSISCFCGVKTSISNLIQLLPSCISRLRPMPANVLIAPPYPRPSSTELALHSHTQSVISINHQLCVQRATSTAKIRLLSLNINLIISCIHLRPYKYCPIPVSRRYTKPFFVPWQRGLL